MFAAIMPTWSLDLIFCAVPNHFSPSANLDHSGGNGILTQFFLRFRQMRVFSDAKGYQHRIHKTAPIPQVVLAVRMATSGAASTGVADLEAAPEVAKINKLYY